MRIRLTVNGTARELDVAPDTPLLWILRDDLGLTGTKYGCGIGACGACTVHVNGNATRSCGINAATANSAQVTTIEGLGAGDTAVQRAWIEEDVAQCGYCQVGQIMAASAFLRLNPRPTDAQIDAAMSANICRCGTYQRIRKAIHRAVALTAASTGGRDR